MRLKGPSWRRQQRLPIPSPARSWWGWGRTEDALPDDECAALGALLPGLPSDPLPVPDVRRPRPADAPRIAPPASLAHRCRTLRLPTRRPHIRQGLPRRRPGAARRLRRRLPTSSPTRATRPRSWTCSTGPARADVAVIPYGGGSSVVGGVEYRGEGDHAGVLSLDLSAMDRVLEVDATSRAARIQAGALGPALEDQLRDRDGLTLRHFPQSFEFSTLGGWLATRAGGHYATLLHAHRRLRRVDARGHPRRDRRVLAPARLGRGPVARPAVPGLRGHARRDHRGVDAAAGPPRPQGVRVGGLHRRRPPRWTPCGRSPSPACTRPTAGCSIPGEAALSGAAHDGASVLVLGVESAHHPVDATGSRELTSPRPPTTAARRPHARRPGRGRGRRAPGARPSCACPTCATGSPGWARSRETFETACTWDRVADLYHDVRPRSARPSQRSPAAPGLVNCRLTHVYPDGAAPYFTVIAAGRRGDEVAMWDEIKAAAMETLARHRRHRHPPPRRRPGPPPRLRPAAPRALRPRAAGRQGRARPARHPQPRRPASTRSRVLADGTADLGSAMLVLVRPRCADRRRPCARRPRRPRRWWRHRRGRRAPAGTTPRWS